MALEATHIKFALDIKDRYKIKELNKYLSGAIYPDSCRLTGIDRKLCHNDDVLSPNFADTDFKKGWAAHFLCDKIQNQVMDKLTSDLLETDGSNAWGTPWWISRTAIKSIVDVEIFKDFDIQPYIPLLDYVENPYHEPIDKIKQYNRIIQRLYKDKKIINPDDLNQMWLDFGISKETIDKITAKTKELMADEKLLYEIKGLYSKMIEMVKNYNHY